jgi:hypothetical protein
MIGLHRFVIGHGQVEYQVVELLRREAGAMQQHAQLPLERLVRALDAAGWARAPRGEIGGGHPLRFGEPLGVGCEHIRGQVEL